MSMIQAFSGARRAMLAAVLLMACAIPASAQQQPSPAAVATASQILALKSAVKIFEPIIPGVIEQAKVLFLRTNPALQKDLNEVAAALRTEFTPRQTEILNEVARLYASHFTEQELKDALVFYKSPLGKKLIEEEPKILDQSMTFGQEWANKLSEQVLSRMRAEMKKKGHDI